MRRMRSTRLSSIGAVIGGAALVASGCTSQDPERVGGSGLAAAAKYDWLQFGGDSRHGGNNTLETTIGRTNVSGLQQLFKVGLPETV